MTDAPEQVEIAEDGYRDVLYEDAQTVEVIRGDGGYHVVKKGLRPFFARLFADGAKLDLSDIKTDVKVNKGGLSKKVFTDPESENVRHRAARIKRRMPVWHRLPEVDEGEEHDIVTKALYGVLTLVVLALPLIGADLAATHLNAPLIGMGLGALVLTIESHGAVDGDIQFEPAPRHFVSADASLTILQNEYSDAKTLEEFEEIAWEERSRTALEARQVEARRDRSITQRLNESALGMDMGVLNGEGAMSEGERERADELLGGPQADDDDDDEASAAATDGGGRR